ncbi:MAG: glycosyltransferase, partial [Acidimicrobiales bacterium]|nr:glycosyltransferase [Acidimicrobiales bacterium]
DAIVEHETGLFHEPGDVDGLARQLVRLAEDPQERRRMGDNARRRIVEQFHHQIVTDALVAFYAELQSAR